MNGLLLVAGAAWAPRASLNDFILFLLIVGVIWALVLAVWRFFDLKRRGFSLHPAVLMWRTSKGLGFIDNAAARFKRGFIRFGTFAAVVGFALMVFVTFNIALNALIVYTRPSIALPGVKFVLPGILPGLSLPVWLVVIGIVLIVHEFCHGFLLRAQGLKTKSVGLLLFLFIPGGFVEPDEKELARTTPLKRIRMFAAGPVSNVLISLVFFALLLVFIVPKPGVYVYGVAENYPLENYAENLLGARILAVNGVPVDSLEEYRAVMENTVAGENAELITDEGEFVVTLAKAPDDNHGVFGIYPASARSRTYFLNPLVMLYMALSVVLTGGFFTPVLYNSLIPWWGIGLLQWLYTLNLGVGLFNLLPAKPLDGGYMLEAALERRVGRARASRVVKWTSYLVLILLILNIVPGVVRMVR